MSPAPNPVAVEARKRHASRVAPPTEVPSRQSRTPDTSPAPRSSGSSDSPLTLTLVAVLTVSVCLALFYFLGLLGPGEWRDASNLTATTPAKVLSLVDERLTSKTSPVLFAFYSRTCPACRRMRRPFTNACSRITDLSLRCFAVDLSAGDDNSPLVERYELKVVPSVILATSMHDYSLYNGRTNAASIERFARDQLAASVAPSQPLTNNKN